MSSSPRAASRASQILAFAFTFAVVLVYALFTNHIWEDYLITYRHSHNLALGNGLVYWPGERVHGFTSPLGTLLPAILNLLTGDRSMELVLWLFRFFTATAFGLTAVGLVRLAARLGWSERTAAFLVGALALDAKSVDFTINGMETAFMLAFLVLTLHVMMSPDNGRWWKLGLCMAALMWTRPDSVVYILVITLVFSVFVQAGDSRRRLARDVMGGAAVCALLYGPWLVWAWQYYGSFIPNTVKAKSQFYNMPRWISRLWPTHVTLFGPDNVLAAVFDPSYARLGGWPSAVSVVSTLLSLICLVPCTLRRFDGFTRAMSLAFLMAVAYLFIGPGFPWYYPSAALFGFITLASLVDRGLRVSPRPVAAVVGLFLVYQAGLTIAVAWESHVQQIVIEAQTRTVVGSWLNEHAAPTDRILLEPLGYIGYYANRKMLDLPGLVAPEVVQVRHQLSEGYPVIIRALWPEWLVLRPWDVRGIYGVDPFLLTEEYTMVHTVDSMSLLQSYGNVPGMGLLMYDSQFAIFHRAK